MAHFPKVLKGIVDALFWGLLALVVVACVVAGYLSLTGVDANLAVPVTFVPDTDTMSIESQTYGPGEVLFATGWVEFEDVGSAAHVVRAVAMITIFFVVLFVVLHLLRRILATVREGGPFVAENVKRIRWIGLLAILGELGGGLTMYLLQDAVSGGSTASGMTLGATFNINPAVILLGFLLIALAEVFRYGGSLQLESDLTV